jgi:hypothetical protein
MLFNSDLCCWSRTSQTKWLKRHLFPTVLKAESPISRDETRGFLVATSHGRQQKRETACARTSSHAYEGRGRTHPFARNQSCDNSVNPPARAETSWPNHLLKGPPLSTTASGLTFQYLNLGRYIQTIAYAMPLSLLKFMVSPTIPLLGIYPK